MFSFHRFVKIVRGRVCTRGSSAGLVSGLFLLLTILSPGPLTALEPGDRCPDFELPWLSGNGRIRLADLLSRKDLTVLLFWNRGCPRCTDLALEVDDLVEFLGPYPAQVVPILFGPDQVLSLRSLLEAEEVQTLHLWDSAGRIASAYGLGTDHLAVFVVDAGGEVRERFDSSITDLIEAVVPAVEVASRQPAKTSSLPQEAKSPLPEHRIDARIRIQDTRNAKSGDKGLYGELLENGAYLLFRWDLRLYFEPVPGIELVPWLRVSNEEDDVLTEGAEQLSSRWGTLSLHARLDRASATLGAYPLRIFPLLLQRWDEDDAPPLGGVAGCPVCAVGVTGVSQRSLEILGPSYTFEGLSASLRQKWVRLRGWFAVTRWERELPRFSGVSARDSLEARYRRVLYGGDLDLGRAGTEDPRLGLRSPIGLRIAYLHVGDDENTVSEEFIRPRETWKEDGVGILARLGPWLGIRAEAEQIWWRLRRTEGVQRWENGWVARYETREDHSWGFLGGVRGRWPAGSLTVWGRAHRIWIEPGFQPLYAALTYRANEEGWRLAGGLELSSPPGESRWALTGFHRRTEETEPVSPELGPIVERVESLTLAGRFIPHLLTGFHTVRTAVEYPHPRVPDSVSWGYSVDLRWEKWPTLDPIARIDAIRTDDGMSDVHTVWQAYLYVRIFT